VEGRLDGHLHLVSDRWGNDPLRTWWPRWRRPVLAVALVVIAIGQWDRLATGHPFNVITALGVIGFFAWLLFTPFSPPPEGRGDVEAWRQHSRRTCLGALAWTAAAVVWFVTGAMLYELRPQNFIILFWPVLLAAVSFWGWRKPERLARAHRDLGDST
jgi:hypothetical protein